MLDDSVQLNEVKTLARSFVRSFVSPLSALQAERRNRLVRVEVEVDELLVDTLRGQGGLPLAHDVAGETRESRLGVTVSWGWGAGLVFAGVPRVSRGDHGQEGRSVPVHEER